MDSKLQFFEAIKTGDLSRVKALLKSDPTLLTIRDEQGVSVILTAIYYGRESVLSELLKHKPILDVWEASAAGQLARVNEILDQDASLIDQHSPDGFTPLGLAAFFGRKDILEALIHSGADADVASRNSMRVCQLHSAVAHHDAALSRQMAEMLLKHGAQVNTPQRGGWTPLHEAASRGDVDLVRLLIQYGADKSVQNDEGITPRDLAQKGGHESVVAILV